MFKIRVGEEARVAETSERMECSRCEFQAGYTKVLGRVGEVERVELDGVTVNFGSESFKFDWGSFPEEVARYCVRGCQLHIVPAPNPEMTCDGCLIQLPKAAPTYTCEQHSFVLCGYCAGFPYPVTYGTRVVRGPTWKWGEQDGGPFTPGTVTDIDNETSAWVEVQWDADNRVEKYRCVPHQDVMPLFQGGVEVNAKLEALKHQEKQKRVKQEAALYAQRHLALGRRLPRRVYDASKGLHFLDSFDAMTVSDDLRTATCVASAETTQITREVLRVGEGDAPVVAHFLVEATRNEGLVFGVCNDLAWRSGQGVLGRDAFADTIGLHCPPSIPDAERGVHAEPASQLAVSVASAQFPSILLPKTHCIATAHGPVAAGDVVSVAIHPSGEVVFSINDVVATPAVAKVTSGGSAPHVQHRHAALGDDGAHGGAQGYAQDEPDDVVEGRHDDDPDSEGEDIAGLPPVGLHRDGSFSLRRAPGTAPPPPSPKATLGNTWRTLHNVQQSVAGGQRPVFYHKFFVRGDCRFAFSSMRRGQRVSLLTQAEADAIFDDRRSYMEVMSTKRCTLHSSAEAGAAALPLDARSIAAAIVSGVPLKQSNLVSRRGHDALEGWTWAKSEGLLVSDEGRTLSQTGVTRSVETATTREVFHIEVDKGIPSTAGALGHALLHGITFSIKIERYSGGALAVGVIPERADLPTRGSLRGGEAGAARAHRGFRSYAGVSLTTLSPAALLTNQEDAYLLSPDGTASKASIRPICEGDVITLVVDCGLSLTILRNQEKLSNGLVQIASPESASGIASLSETPRAAMYRFAVSIHEGTIIRILDSSVACSPPPALHSQAPDAPPLCDTPFGVLATGQKVRAPFFSMLLFDMKTLYLHERMKDVLGQVGTVVGVEDGSACISFPRQGSSGTGGSPMRGSRSPSPSVPQQQGAPQQGGRSPAAVTPQTGSAASRSTASCTTDTDGEEEGQLGSTQQFTTCHADPALEQGVCDSEDDHDTLLSTLSHRHAPSLLSCHRQHEGPEGGGSRAAGRHTPDAGDADSDEGVGSRVLRGQGGVAAYAEAGPDADGMSGDPDYAPDEHSEVCTEQYEVELEHELELDVDLDLDVDVDDDAESFYFDYFVFDAVVERRCVVGCPLSVSASHPHSRACDGCGTVMPRLAPCRTCHAHDFLLCDFCCGVRPDIPVGMRVVKGPTHNHPDQRLHAAAVGTVLHVHPVAGGITVEWEDETQDAAAAAGEGDGAKPRTWLGTYRGAPFLDVMPAYGGVAVTPAQGRQRGSSSPAQPSTPRVGRLQLRDGGSDASGRSGARSPSHAQGYALMAQGVADGASLTDSSTDEVDDTPWEGPVLRVGEELRVPAYSERLRGQRSRFGGTMRRTVGKIGTVQQVRRESVVINFGFDHYLIDYDLFPREYQRLCFHGCRLGRRVVAAWFYCSSCFTQLPIGSTYYGCRAHEFDLCSYCCGVPFPLLVGTTVKRGPTWAHAQEDGGDFNPGTVVAVVEDATFTASLVYVRWARSPRVFVYRGAPFQDVMPLYDGGVEVKKLTTARRIIADTPAAPWSTDSTLGSVSFSPSNAQGGGSSGLHARMQQLASTWDRDNAASPDDRPQPQQAVVPPTPSETFALCVQNELSVEGRMALHLPTFPWTRDEAPSFISFKGLYDVERYTAEVLAAADRAPDTVLPPLFTDAEKKAFTEARRKREGTAHGSSLSPSHSNAASPVSSPSHAMAHPPKVDLSHYQQVCVLNGGRTALSLTTQQAAAVEARAEGSPLAPDDSLEGAHTIVGYTVVTKQYYNPWSGRGDGGSVCHFRVRRTDLGTKPDASERDSSIVSGVTLGIADESSVPFYRSKLDSENFPGTSLGLRGGTDGCYVVHSDGSFPLSTGPLRHNDIVTITVSSHDRVKFCINGCLVNQQFKIKSYIRWGATFHAPHMRVDILPRDAAAAAQPFPEEYRGSGVTALQQGAVLRGFPLFNHTDLMTLCLKNLYFKDFFAGAEQRRRYAAFFPSMQGGVVQDETPQPDRQPGSLPLRRCGTGAELGTPLQTPIDRVSTPHELCVSLMRMSQTQQQQQQQGAELLALGRPSLARLDTAQADAAHAAAGMIDPIAAALWEGDDECSSTSDDNGSTTAPPQQEQPQRDGTAASGCLPPAPPAPPPYDYLRFREAVGANLYTVEILEVSRSEVTFRATPAVADGVRAVRSLVCSVYYYAFHRLMERRCCRGCGLHPIALGGGLGGFAAELCSSCSCALPVGLQVLHCRAHNFTLCPFCCGVSLDIAGDSRVVRGPTWAYDDQDGGVTQLGTVIDIHTDASLGTTDTLACDDPSWSSLVPFYGQRQRGGGGGGAGGGMLWPSHCGAALTNIIVKWDSGGMCQYRGGLLQDLYPALEGVPAVLPEGLDMSSPQVLPKVLTPVRPFSFHPSVAAELLHAEFAKKGRPRQQQQQQQDGQQARAPFPEGAGGRAGDAGNSANSAAATQRSQPSPGAPGSPRSSATAAQLNKTDHALELLMKQARETLERRLYVEHSDGHHFATRETPVSLVCDMTGTLAAMDSEGTAPGAAFPCTLVTREVYDSVQRDGEIRCVIDIVQLPVPNEVHIGACADSPAGYSAMALKDMVHEGRFGIVSVDTRSDASEAPPKEGVGLFQAASDEEAVPEMLPFPPLQQGDRVELVASASSVLISVGGTALFNQHGMQSTYRFAVSIPTPGSCVSIADADPEMPAPHVLCTEGGAVPYVVKKCMRVRPDGCGAYLAAYQSQRPAPACGAQEGTPPAGVLPKPRRRAAWSQSICEAFAPDGVTVPEAVPEQGSVRQRGLGEATAVAAQQESFSRSMAEAARTAATGSVVIVKLMRLLDADGHSDDGILSDTAAEECLPARHFSAFKSNVEVLKRVSHGHPNLLKLHGIMHDPHYAGVCTEACTQSLVEYLTTHEVPHRTKVSLLQQLLRALLHIEGAVGLCGWRFSAQDMFVVEGVLKLSLCPALAPVAHSGEGMPSSSQQCEDILSLMCLFFGSESDRWSPDVAYLCMQLACSGGGVTDASRSPTLVEINSWFAELSPDESSDSWQP